MHSATERLLRTNPKSCGHRAQPDAPRPCCCLLLRRKSGRTLRATDMQRATHDPDPDPIAALQVSNDRRILLLVMDGLGGLPRAPGGPHRAGGGAHPEPRCPGPRCRVRAAPPHRLRHRPRLGARSPGPVRLRPAAVPDRPRHRGRARHRLPGAERGRRRAPELRHPRRCRGGNRPPRRAYPHRAVRRAGRAAGRDRPARGGGGGASGARLPRRGGVARCRPQRRGGRHRSAGHG